jgi:uncharacterized protein YerC
MAHVATRPLPKKIRAEIDAQLVRLLARNGSRSMSVLNELLTETERLMLAKRLAAILMLAEDFSYFRISRTLIMSTSTLKRLHQQLIGDEFTVLETVVRERKNRKALFEMVGTIVRLGMPPRGRGRWKNIDRILARSPK